ncbi:MAG: glycosyltransferase family 2 protein [Gemmatimonadaceae bacterium]
MPENRPSEAPRDPVEPAVEPPAVEPMLPLPFALEPREQRRPTLCLVLPAYNEEASLPLTHAALRDALDELEVSWRLLFVNDGSRDGTAGVLERLYRQDERVGYLLLSRNFGHQAALTAGLEHAEGDVVICMDADLQHPPALLRTMLEAWRDGYDVVHTRKLATVDLSRGRAVATEVAYGLVSRVSEVTIIPQASDYRLMDRQVLDALRSLPEKRRLYRGLTPWVGFRQCVLPYVAGARAAGASQYNLKQLFALFTRALFDFSDAPLYSALIVGLAALGFSTLGLVVVAVASLLGRAPASFGVGTALILFVGALNLCATGLVGAYVARIYAQVLGRPTYLVSRVRVRAPERREPPDAP